MSAKSKSPLISWTKELESLRTLSLRQPWGLVVNGYKDIENRSWRTNHRGPLLIHASSTNSTLLTGDWNDAVLSRSRERLSKTPRPQHRTR
jgi:hypothetical protein